MSDEKDAATVHAVALLIPAKLNGTLSAGELEQLDAHLAGCPACRRELEEYSSLRTRLAEVYGREPGASPGSFTRVMARVRDPSPMMRIDAWVRGLLGAPWAPTFAAVLVLAQFGLLAWVVSQPREDEVVSRSVSAPAARFSIGFRDTATHREIQGLLRELGGRIVDGPSAEGLYRVEITGASEAATAQARGVLHRRTDIVRSVE